MIDDIKEVISLAVDLCSTPEVYDSTIARDLVNLALEVDDFDQDELLDLRVLVRQYWNVETKLSSRWNKEELLNLALVTSSNPLIKEKILTSMKIEPT